MCEEMIIPKPFIYDTSFVECYLSVNVDVNSICGLFLKAFSFLTNLIVTNRARNRFNRFPNVSPLNVFVKKCLFLGSEVLRLLTL